MAKPNYNYQKKQKELARAAKQAAKRDRRQAAKAEEPATAPEEAGSPAQPDPNRAG